MNLDRVTITGADDMVSVDDLVLMQEKYPFVEWGILFSRNNVARFRYPSEEWVHRFLDKHLNSSAHFCGWHSREVIENSNYDLIRSVGGFGRVQLNYNFETSRHWNLTGLVEWTKDNPDISIILQYNPANRVVMNKLIESHQLPANIHFLHDDSGGRGRRIIQFNDPFENYTGYSGGIGPHIIQSVTNYFTRAKTQIKNPFWLDMETGIRTDNVFDLNKVEFVLEKCGLLINKTTQK